MALLRQRFCPAGLTTWSKVFLTEHFRSLTHWLLTLFCQKRIVLAILEIFRLETSQISFNQIKKAFTTWQLSFLAIAFYNILAQACTEIQILRSDLRLKAFWFFSFSFRLSFFSFSFLFAAVIGLLLGLLAVKKLLRKRHRDRQFLPWRNHNCSGRKFAPSFSLTF